LPVASQGHTAEPAARAQESEAEATDQAKMQSLAIEIDTEHERSVLYRVAIVAELVCLLMLVRSFVMIWLER
jgi:hypothetical protein